MEYKSDLNSPVEIIFANLIDQLNVNFETLRKNFKSSTGVSLSSATNIGMIKFSTTGNSLHIRANDDIYQIPFYKNISEINNKLGAITNTGSGAIITIEEREKLAGVETGANNYSLPAATLSDLGGVKPDGITTSATGDGTLVFKGSATGGISESDQAKLNAITNTGSGAIITIEEREKLAGVETGANNYSLPATTLSNLGGVKPDGITTSATGDGTLVFKGSATGGISESDQAKLNAITNTGSGAIITIEEREKLAGVETGANKYSLPAATLSNLGGVKPDGITTSATGDGTLVFKGSATGGISESDQAKLNAITKTGSGAIITIEEREKLAGVETGANKYSLPAATLSNLGGVKTDGITTSATGDGTLVFKGSATGGISESDQAKLNAITNTGSGAIITIEEREKINNSIDENTLKKYFLI